MTSIDIITYKTILSELNRRGIKKICKESKVSTGLKLSKGEETMAQHLDAYKIPYKREYYFCPDRRYRFDFAILQPFKRYLGIAIEIEGGREGKSRHTSYTGMKNDCTKYAHAVLLGWGVFRFTTEQVMSGEAIDFIRKATA